MDHVESLKHGKTKWNGTGLRYATRTISWNYAKDEGMKTWIDLVDMNGKESSTLTRDLGPEDWG